MASLSALVQYKLGFLGDQSVGKTGIITRFMHDKFDNPYQLAHCWGCSKPMQFAGLGPEFYQILVVWSLIGHITPVAGWQSFLNTSKWIEEVRTEWETDVIIVLVRNKTDLVHKRRDP
ncbi:hypothetical protein GW17_00008237 [Ensete ventricosum]|nr:hypothetical protein GW17_00008237 [Ensete ventricosum]RZS21303.1 hypothetical protein BHM03_00053927 [Ensete ventricosum]